MPKQAPKSNKSPPKKEKEGFGPWADTKITWATPQPTLKLLSIKECTSKKVLIVMVQMFRMISLTHLAKEIDQVDSKIKVMG